MYLASLLVQDGIATLISFVTLYQKTESTLPAFFSCLYDPDSSPSFPLSPQLDAYKQDKTIPIPAICFWWSLKLANKVVYNESLFTFDAVPNDENVLYMVSKVFLDA